MKTSHYSGLTPDFQSKNGIFFCMDNMEVIPALRPNSIHLIYNDPPYFSNKDYYERIDGVAKPSFSDQWEGGLEEYLDWLSPRLKAMHKTLAPNGVLLIHLDWHASHYVKTLLDNIFSQSNFICEFIWRMFSPHLSKGKRQPAKIHQSILAYAKNINQFTYHPQYIGYREYYHKRARSDPNGRLWVDQNLGKLKSSTISKLQKEGRIFTTKTGRLRRKQYLDEMPGEQIGTVISHIERINSQSKERRRYDTQKPQALIALFVAMFSNPDDLVADFFCGSGTVPVVCEEMNRQWIACDINRQSLTITKDRLRNISSPK